jgi:antitoxin component YwqK of YwqJK toxin-antitoxin module
MEYYEYKSYLHFTKIYNRRCKCVEFISYKRDNNHIEYRLDGKRHNNNGPAYIAYYSNGIVKYIEYSVDNKRHNTNGPAFIMYYSNGTVMREEYWIDGVQQ